MMVGFFTAILGLTFTTTLLVKEYAHQNKVVLGQVEKQKIKEVVKFDKEFNLGRVASSSNPEKYVRDLVGERNGLKVYVAEEMLRGNPCQSRSGLRVRLVGGMEHSNVAYVIVKEDRESGSVLTPVSGLLDLSHVRGPVKVVKDTEFIEKRCRRS